MGNSKIIKIEICSNCGKEVPIYHKNRLKHKNIFCDKECESIFKKSKNLNCECEVCHKKFHRKPSQKSKNKHQYCSVNCHNKAKSTLMLGENNHQYRLKGSLNSSWKSDERISSYGYKLIRNLNHPFKNSDDFVFEHRLVAEKYLLNKNNSVLIENKLYLSPNFHVHHLDFDRLNNSPENLYVLPKSLHIKFHDSLKKVIRNNDGTISTVEKQEYSKDELKYLFYKFINEVNELSDTKRGENGFGSTGKQ